MRTFIVAALAALAVLTAPAAAVADPDDQVGNGCYYTVDPGVYVYGTIVELPAPDWFGCDDGATVNTTLWFYDEDGFACAYGSEAIRDRC